MYDTPRDIANKLAEHAPLNARVILEPAVGNGALIAPFLGLRRYRQTKFVLLDNDRDALLGAKVQTASIARGRASFIHDDFLRWSNGTRSRFDCIVMNPPFHGTVKMGTRVRLPDCFSGGAIATRFMPVEAAFLCCALRILREGGRLLAVLPSSVVMGERLAWLREEIFRAGAIRMVHELPYGCFPRVESRMYLFVFEKGLKSRSVHLLNHDVYRPERIKVSWPSSNLIHRLDYGFHFARLLMDRIMEDEKLEWRRLGDMAAIYRGQVKSPLGSTGAVHTTDFRDGSWLRSKKHKRSIGKERSGVIQEGDILVRRVGRASHETFGGAEELHGLQYSDCVLVIRPNEEESSIAILFALQAIFINAWVKALVERGTGANYISLKSLSDVLIPVNLNMQFHSAFRLYRKALDAKAVSDAQDVIRAVSDSLFKLGCPAPLEAEKVLSESRFRKIVAP